MKSCVRCNRVLRRDENLQHTQYAHEGGIASAQICPYCVADINDQPPPEPRTYPVGCRMPREPGSDGDLRICGLCRRALYWDDAVESMRVPPNDEGVEEGVYATCRECLAIWRPRILEYRIQEGVLPPTATLREVAGNMLL